MKKQLIRNLESESKFWWGTLSMVKFEFITLSLKMQKIINYVPHQHFVEPCMKAI